MTRSLPDRSLARVGLVAVLVALVTVGLAAGAPLGPDGSTAATQQANEEPTAAFVYTPDEPEPGETITLNASGSSDPDGEIAEYRWDFDDDGQVEATGGPNRRLAFPRAGEYPVTLTVVDDDGATDSTTVTVVVVGTQPPTADLSVSPAEVTVGEPVTFDPSGSSDPDGQLVSWAYDVDGDGSFEQTFDAPTTFRTNYNTSGEFEVTLRVTDNDGMTATATTTVVVEPRDTATRSTASPGGPTTTGPGDGGTPAGPGDGVAPGGGFPWAALAGALVVLLVLGGIAALVMRNRTVDRRQKPPGQSEGSAAVSGTLGRVVAALVVVLVFVVAPAFAIDRSFAGPPVQAGALGAALVQLVAVVMLGVVAVLWLLFRLVEGLEEDVRRGPVIGPLTGDGFRWVVLAFGFLAAALLSVGLATLLLSLAIPFPTMVAAGLILGGLTVVPLVLAFVLVTLALD